MDNTPVSHLPQWAAALDQGLARAIRILTMSVVVLAGFNLLILGYDFARWSSYMAMALGIFTCILYGGARYLGRTSPQSVVKVERGCDRQGRRSYTYEHERITAEIIGVYPCASVVQILHELHNTIFLTP